MNDLLLDTCALVCTALGQDIGARARKAIEARTLHVSAISALEIGSLVRQNRLMIDGPATLWFDTLLRRLNARLSALPPTLLIASTELAGDPPKDPLDRIMITTARERDLTLVTRDRVILAYCKLAMWRRWPVDRHRPSGRCVMDVVDCGNCRFNTEWGT